jgi:hypothetical protein
MLRRAVVALLLTCCSGCPPHGPPPERQRTELDAGIPPYNRDEWGRWSDADRDCQDTRQEVLIAESEAPVTFADPAKPCRVVSGRWTDVYSGQVYTLSSDLQIDHVVALEEAHNAGGWRWTPEQKKAYFNDLDNPGHLVAVSQSSNASKGSRPPSQWMPPNAAYRCEYIRQRVRIFQKYGLSYDCAAYVELAATHCRQP